MRNQTSFRLTTTLLPTDMTAKTTQVINKVDENGDKFYPTFTEETIVLTNDDRTVMETARATASNGVLTFTKRGLSDDVSETQVANRKLTRNPGSLVFITAGAADWIDKDDSVTWTGNQTYTGELTSTNKATYKGQLITEKGVKYPNFADVTALQAYDAPFAGMFATVDDTGELYRYNAKTCCWDMVSSVSLGTYEIRCSAARPDSCTGDTIVTISPELNEIYMGTKGVVVNNYVDLLIVGGGGGGGYAQCNSSIGGGGGGAGGVVKCVYYPVISESYCVKVGAGGAGAEASSGCFGCNGCPTSFGGLTVLGGGGGAPSGRYEGKDGANGGGGGSTGCCSRPSYRGGYGYGSSFAQGKNGGASRCFSSSQTGGLGGGGQGGSVKSDGSSSTGVNGGCRYEIGGCLMYVAEGGGGSQGGVYCAGVSWNVPGASSTVCGGGGGAAGGSCCTGGWTAAGAGKGGIAMIAYPSDGSYGIHCATGGTVTTCAFNGKTYCIHTFTSDGTFTIIN